MLVFVFYNLIYILEKEEKMKIIVEYLKSPEFSTVIIAIMLGIIIGFYMAFRTAIREAVSIERWKEKFFKALDLKFDYGLVKERKDIEILINSFRGNRPINIVRVLEDYLRYILKEDKHSDENNYVKNKYKSIMDVIDEIKKEKPFEDIPGEERRILINMRNAIRNNDTQIALINIDDLCSIMKTRQRDYILTKKINMWSVPIAIITFVFTILFGLINLAK